MKHNFSLKLKCMLVEKYRCEYQNSYVIFLDSDENISCGLDIVVKGNERVASRYRDLSATRGTTLEYEFVLPGVHCVIYPGSLH